VTLSTNNSRKQVFKSLRCEKRNVVLSELFHHFPCCSLKKKYNKEGEKGSRRPQFIHSYPPPFSLSLTLCLVLLLFVLMAAKGG